MKKFHVLIEATCSIVVEAENEDAAWEAANDRVHYGDFEMETGHTNEITGDKFEINSYERHAAIRIGANGRDYKKPAFDNGEATAG